MLVISKHEQGTPEWFSDRLGKVTGSSASAIMAKSRTKGAESETRKKYKRQLALESLNGCQVAESFSNRHTERGKELEQFARMAYEIKTGEMVEEAGFCYQEGAGFGCSVDGFIDDRKGIIEIKCPTPITHAEYIEDNCVPSEYLVQVIHNLVTTGSQYCDFVSYCETMPEKLKLFVYRFTPTKEQLSEYKAELEKFLLEVEAKKQEYALLAA